MKGEIIPPPKPTMPNNNKNPEHKNQHAEIKSEKIPRNPKTRISNHVNQHDKIKSEKIRKSRILVCILEYVSEGKTQIEIINSTKIPKSTVSDYILKAQQGGLIQHKINSRPKFYSLTNKGRKFLKEYTKSGEIREFSLGMRNLKTNAHRLRIKIPIVHDLHLHNWKRETKINHWVKKYSPLNFPFEVTIEKTTKNIILHLHEKSFVHSLEFTSELIIWVSKALVFCEQYLRHKLGVSVDLGRARIIDQHFATQYKSYDPVVDPKLQVSLDLGRKAMSVLGPTKQRAKAWVDRSHGVLELEANDMDYTRKLISMPENVDNLNSILPASLGVLEGFTEQISNHLAVIEGINSGINEFNGSIKQLNDLLSVIALDYGHYKARNGGYHASTIDRIKQFWGNNKKI